LKGEKKREGSECDYASIIRKKGKYKYDFKSLEYKCQKSYDEFVRDCTNSENFRTLYEDLFVITHGILETTPMWVKKESLNAVDVAHEYSTGLIERILESKWRAKVNPGEDKFSWVPYIRLNVRDTIYRKFSSPNPEKYISLDEIKEIIKEQSTDSEDSFQHVQHPALVDADIYHLTQMEVNNNQLASQCSKFLRLLFGDQYYTLSSKFLSIKAESYDDIQDLELRLFAKTALVLFKRLYESYNLSKLNSTRVDKVFGSSLYLASILSSERDKRLYVSLDLANLYRLSLAYGGDTLRVPTLEELEELISTAKVSYEILSSNLCDANKIRRIRDKIRDDYDVFVRFDKLSENVKGVFRYLSTEIMDPSVADDNSLVDSLFTLSSRSDKIINKILDRMEDTLATVDKSDDLIKVYKEMVENLTLSLNLMTNVKSLMESRFKENGDVQG
jgi:hypothetical protein